MASKLTPITTLPGKIDAAAKKVCGAIDKAHGLEGEEKEALRDLREGIVGLQSETKVYEVLITAIIKDSDASERIQRSNIEGAIDGLKQVLEDTQLLLEWDLRRPSGVATNAVGSRTQRSTLKSVLDVLETKSRTRRGFADTINHATNEIHLRQRTNDRAFKLFWNLYTIAHQPISRRSSKETIKDQMGQAHDAILDAFHSHPFAILPREDSTINQSTLAVFNRDDESATEYEKLARKIGETWVGDRIPQEAAEVRDLGSLQASLFELVWSGLVEQLKDHSAYSKEDPEQVEFQLKLVELERGLQEAIVRSKKQRFTIAFCGMVKAGKSLFLNALIGRGILPSDELPSTAWPCRLRHVDGQTKPELQFNSEPFLTPLKKLQEHQYGQKLEHYRPPPENMFDELLSDVPSKPSEEELRLKIIHSQWVDLHRDTRRNLLKFEKPGFQLPKTATGEEEVKKLLSEVNDVVRLCQKFDLHFDMNEVDWPLLTLEFSCLRGRKMDEEYEFIDLPGIGESFRDFNFESLVRRVASDSSAIVPIISFKELPRSDWKCLPELLASGRHGRANVVVCTHLDQVSQDNIEEQILTITKTFWSGALAEKDRVITCSSIMGLSARDLLDKSTASMPLFETIWDNHTVGYRCAEKLLGLANARTNYSIIGHKKWKDQLENELKTSGLPQAIKQLTIDVVDRGRVNALLNETDGIVKQLRDIGTLQCRRLLEARRTTDDYNAAKSNYDRARKEFEAVLDTWSREEEKQIQENCQFLERSSDLISQTVPTLINQAIERTLEKWRPAGIQSGDRVVVGDDPSAASRVVTVRSVADAEEFLRLSQSALRSLLDDMKHNYVKRIRTLAADAMKKRFKALHDAIQNLDAKQPALQKDIIDDLDSQAIDPHKIVFKQIRKVIKYTRNRYTARTAFRAIEEMIARPLLNPSGDAVENAVQERIEELGFILRAPITVLATVPFVFGFPIWPFITHTRSYHLEMDVIRSHYKDDVISPWVKSLKEEGEKSLTGAIKASSIVAKDSVTSALEREDNRYKRELEEKKQPAGATQHLISVYGNIVAAEEALKQLLIQIRRLKEQDKDH